MNKINIKNLITTPTIPSDINTLIQSNKTSLEKFRRNQVIKVIVWNTYKAKKKGFYEDLEKLSKDSDLILLQESIFKKEDLEKHLFLNNKDTVIAVSFYTKEEIPTGVCTISSSKHLKEKYIRSSVTEPLLKTHKMALITTYSFGILKKLTVINVHGINFVGTKKFETHMNQISQELETFKGPVIIAGDFNSWSAKRALLIKRLARENKLKEVVLKEDKRKIKLDKIYVKGIKVQNAKILNNIISSDHKPLYFEFKVKKFIF